MPQGQGQGGAVFKAVTSSENGNKRMKFQVMRGTVVLAKKGFLSSVMDAVHELIGNTVSFRLVSAVSGDPGECPGRGFLSVSSFACWVCPKMLTFLFVCLLLGLDFWREVGAVQDRYILICGFLFSFFFLKLGIH